MMKKILASVSVGIFPLLVSAQTYTTTVTGGIGGIMIWVRNILNAAVPLILSLAVVWFIWNVFRFAIAGSEEDKTKAKTQMVWGIVAIFVMVSVWGLVAILTSTFGTTGQGALNGPTINQLPQ